MEADEGNEEEIGSKDSVGPVQENERQEGVQGGMSWQLPAGDDLPEGYTAIKKAAKDKIAALIGQEATVTSRSMGSIIWKVVAPAVFFWGLLPRIGESEAYFQEFFLELFQELENLRLTSKNWRSKVEKMNEAMLAT